MERLWQYAGRHRRRILLGHRNAPLHQSVYSDDAAHYARSDRWHRAW